MPELTESQKDQTREQKHWRNKMDREFMAPTISPAMMWIVAIIFSAGCAYTFVMRIPAIEKKQERQALQLNTVEANYTTMKDDVKEIKGDIKVLLRRK